MSPEQQQVDELTELAAPLQGGRAEGRPPGLLRSLLLPGVFLRAVLVATLLTYLPSIAFDFVWDDRLQIALNPWMGSWRFVPRFFTNQVWAFDPFHVGGNYYRPLFLLWLFLIDHATGGAPGWFHLASIALHLGVVAEVYVLAQLLTRKAGVAAVAAMIFALHPGKVEAVAWISGVTDPLCAFFFLATVICWLRWRDDGGGSGWKAAALLSLALSLLTKETGILAPALLGVWEWHRQRGGVAQRTRAVTAKLWPFGAVVCGYLALRWHALHGLSQASLAAAGVTTLLSAPLVAWWYIRHLVWPVGLSVFYDPIAVTHFSWLRVALPAAALVAAGVALRRATGRSAEGAMLFWWLPLTLAPAIASVGLVQMHDRYLYLPSFSFAVGVAWLIMGGRTRNDGAIDGSRALVAVALGAVLALGTLYEARPWDNDMALFGRAIQKAPGYVPARWYLAGAYMDEGRDEDARKVLLQTTALFPEELRGWELLGRLEYEHGQIDAAGAAFRRVLAIPSADRDKDFSLYSLGAIAQSRGDLAAAESWYQRALTANPGSQGARQALEAVQELEAATNRKGGTNAPFVAPKDPLH